MGRRAVIETVTSARTPRFWLKVVGRKVDETARNPDESFFVRDRSDDKSYGCS